MKHYAKLWSSVLLMSSAGFVVGCGGDDGIAPDDSSTPDGSAADGLDTTDETSGGGGEGYLGARFAKQVVAASGRNPVLADTDTPMVAFASSFGVSVATREADTWTLEDAASGSVVGSVDFVVIGDTRWVAFTQSGAPSIVAFSVNGAAWQREELPGRARSLAIAADGAAPLVVASVDNGVELFQRVEGTWQSERVASFPLGTEVGTVDLAVDGSARHLFGILTGSLWYAAGPAGALVTSTLITDSGFSASDLDDTLDVVVGQDSRIYLMSQQSAQGGRVVVSTVRVLDGVTWTVLASGSAAPPSGNGLAVASDGQVWGAYFAEEQIQIGQLAGNAFLSQVLVGSVRDADIDLSVGPRDQLRVVTSTSNGIQFFERGEDYPAGYGTKCARVAEVVCERACETCAVGFAGTPNSDCTLAPGSTFGSSACRVNAGQLVCDDASQDPSLLDACLGEIGTAECITDAEALLSGVVLPPGGGCASLFDR